MQVYFSPNDNLFKGFIINSHNTKILSKFGISGAKQSFIFFTYFMIYIYMCVCVLGFGGSLDLIWISLIELVFSQPFIVVYFPKYVNRIFHNNTRFNICKRYTEPAWQSHWTTHYIIHSEINWCTKLSQSVSSC